MSISEDINNIKDSLKNVVIHIIPYCHADYAWTHPRIWHINRYEQIISEVLDVINSNSDYIWMADNIFPMLETCLSYGYSRYDEFWKRVKEGKIEITNGILTLIRPTMTGDETFIRNIALGKEYLKTIISDFNTEIFHNVDVSIGHSQLPQILLLGGYKYYRGWRPQGAMDAKGIPRHFNWEGIDGSSIICSRGTYAGFWNADYMDKETFSDNDGSLIEFYNTEIKDILDHTDSKHIWIPFGMDDTRPMRDVKDIPVNLDSFMEYFRKETEATVFYSNAENYFSGLEKSELPVFKGALDPCDVGYNISSKGDKGLWHKRILLDRLLVSAESLWTMAALNGKKYPENEFKVLWHNLMLICSHGMEFVYADDYEKIYKLAEDSVSSVKRLIEEAKILITGQSLDFENPQYKLINVLNWDRHDTVFLPLEKEQTMHPFEVKDFNGHKLNHQLVFSDLVHLENPTGVLVETSVPPMGCSTVAFNKIKPFNLQKSPGPKNNSLKPVEVDTGKTRVLFECGSIKSINEFTDLPENDFYMGKICFTELNQTPNDAWLYNNKRGTTYEMMPLTWVWHEFGPLRWKYVVTGTVDKYNFRQEITLYKNKSIIDFYLQLDCSQKGSGFFSAVFPADKKTEFMADIPFGIENRDIINEPFGVVTDIAIDNLERLWEGVFYAKSWINYSIGKNNITLFGTDCPRYYWYNQKEKSVSFILNRNYILDECTDWMKDTHHWNETPGIITFAYSASIEEKEQNSSFLPKIKFSKEMQVPIEIAKIGDIQKKTSGSLQSYFDIKSESSVISALYIDCGKVILRIYNASDFSDKLEISCCKKIISYKITDFLQNELPEKSHVSEKQNNCIHISASPWEILTVVMEILI